MYYITSTVEGIMGREHLEKHIFVPAPFLDYKLSWKNLSQVTVINTTAALLQTPTD